MASNAMVDLNGYCTKNRLKIEENYEYTGPSHYRLYVCTLTVRGQDSGRVPVTGRGEGKNKKEAKMKAAQDIMTKITDEEVEATDSEAVPSPKTPEGPNYKVHLQEYCQKKGLGIPSYSVLRTTGPAHQLQFEIKCTVYRCYEELIGEGVGVGNSKKVAEIEAAKKVFDFLKTENPQHETIALTPGETETPPPSPLVEGNNKNKLQELCQRNGFEIPKYIKISQTGPSHSMDYTVKCCVMDSEDELVAEDKGFGKTVKSAEMEAAGKVIEKLTKVLHLLEKLEEGEKVEHLDLSVMKTLRVDREESMEYASIEDLTDIIMSYNCSTPQFIVQKTDPVDKDDPSTMQYLCLAHSTGGEGFINNTGYDTSKMPIVGHGSSPLEEDAKKLALNDLLHNIKQLQA
uniref:DRBM domain-containing protein n=1 Tax=Amphimedon queenslandica TaxID=400682 RepID=A0A1X7T5U2_AMPQE